MGIKAVCVDSREPAWCKQLKFGGVPVTTTLLEAGDFLIVTDENCLLALERKEVSDFLNTLRDDRLFNQLARLRELTPWAYLAVVGDLRPHANGITYCDGRETGWKWPAIQGALLTVQEMGLHVIYIANDYDFEDAMIRLANRSRAAVRVRPIRETTMLSEGESILACLPGIGPDRAAALAAQFTPARAIAWLTTLRDDPPITVPGVSIGTQARVRKVLGLQAWQSLDLVIHERERS